MPNGIRFCSAGKMRYAAFAGMGRSAPKLFAAYLFMRYGFHHVRTRNKHVRGIFHH